jgi:long-chain acyl-CoA synthetase
MDKIWLKSYPADVPPEVDTSRFSSLLELFAHAFETYPDKVAFISMGKTMTYRELDQESRQFAAWLQAIGMHRGDRVALMMPNLLQYPVALLGTLRAGCVVVSCNPLYTPRELEHQLKDSGSKAIVIVENFAHTLEPVLPHTLIEHVVVTPMGEMLGALKGALVNFVVRHVKKLVPAYHLPAAINFQTALQAGRAHGFQPVSFTQAYAWIKSAVREGEEVIVTALPLYHVFALTANLLMFLKIGATNLLIANPRDIPGFIKEWGKYPVTVMTGVNTLFAALLNHPDFAKLNFAKFRLTLGGGMAVQAPVAEHWQQVTGVQLLQAYGLTETSPAATINPMNLERFNGSIGLPIPSTDCAIRDDAGQDVQQGQIGEICLRGPQVMKGYWQRPEETAQVFHPDGFLRTGDMGYMDPQGFVYLVDRKKDMILVSGFNVYPNEVEEAVAMHAGVLYVAAIGVPDEHSGEAVKIFVVRKDPALTEHMLKDHCRTVLTGYKVPKHIEFRDDLPRTNVGKILRRVLKEEEMACRSQSH